MQRTGIVPDWTQVVRQMMVGPELPLSYVSIPLHMINSFQIFRIGDVLPALTMILNQQAHEKHQRVEDPQPLNLPRIFYQILVEDPDQARIPYSIT